MSQSEAPMVLVLAMPKILSAQTAQTRMVGPGHRSPTWQAWQTPLESILLGDVPVQDHCAGVWLYYGFFGVNIFNS